MHPRLPYYQYACIFLFFMLSIMHGPLRATTYGSWTAGLLQTTRALLPTGATDNILQGFSQFDAGFLLEDAATTCTFDADFPVLGRVALYGGQLYLNRDLQVSYVDSPFGTIRSNPATPHSVEFGSQPSGVVLPALGQTGVMNLRLLSSQTIGTNVFSADWNYTGVYLAAVTNTALQDYTFNGATLTAFHNVAIGRQVNTVRWHPTGNYLVIGLNTGIGNEFRAYQETGAALAVLAGGIDVGASSALACAWHPSGNFVVGGISGAANNVQSYPFTTAGGLAASVSNYTSGAVSRDALAFAPGGNFLAVGSATSPQLRVLSFSGAGALALSVSNAVGQTVQCVDWSPTGTYVAVGTVAGTETLRIYAHDVAGGTLTERTTARVGEANAVYGVHWDKTGRYLLVGLATSTNSELRVYYFDQALQELIPLYENATNIASNVQAARWSRDAKYVARGIAAAASNISAYSVTQELSPLRLDNTNFTFNNDLTLSVSLQFNGNCDLNCRGNRINFQSGGELAALSKANLIIENAELTNLNATSLRCMADDASIVLRNCILNLTGDYIFSQGALVFDSDVIVTGSSKFIYSSGMTSSINSQTQLLFDTGTTFSYVPTVSQRNLLTMADPTSVLYLNGCTLFATRTGLQLSNGTLMLDGRVTMSSAARYTAEGIGLSSNLAINVLGGATLDVFGIVRAD